MSIKEETIAINRDWLIWVSKTCTKVLSKTIIQAASTFKHGQLIEDDESIMIKCFLLPLENWGIEILQSRY